MKSMNELASPAGDVADCGVPSPHMHTFGGYSLLRGGTRLDVSTLAVDIVVLVMVTAYP